MTKEKIKEIIKEWCEKNLTTHTDWTGTRVETKQECESVDDLFESLWRAIKQES